MRDLGCRLWIAIGMSVLGTGCFVGAGEPVSDAPASTSNALQTENGLNSINGLAMNGLSSINGLNGVRLLRQRSRDGPDPRPRLRLRRHLPVRRPLPCARRQLRSKDCVFPAHGWISARRLRLLSRRKPVLLARRNSLEALRRHPVQTAAQLRRACGPH